jgi:cytochrome c-type biogenesis protein CcmE
VRGRVIAAIAVCAVAVVAIVGLAVALSQNVVYFRTVSEAVNERNDGGGDGRFRMAGEVVPGSVEETATGVRFRVTDGDATAEVEHQGDPPDLFEAGAPVVCEGRWGDDATFDSDRILIRHGNEYDPPDVEGSEATNEAGS